MGGGRGGGAQLSQVNHLKGAYKVLEETYIYIPNYNTTLDQKRYLILPGCKQELNEEFLQVLSQFKKKKGEGVREGRRERSHRTAVVEE